MYEGLNILLSYPEAPNPNNVFNQTLKTKALPKTIAWIAKCEYDLKTLFEILVKI